MLCKDCQRYKVLSPWMDQRVCQNIKIERTNKGIPYAYGDEHFCKTDRIDCVTGHPIYVDCYTKNVNGGCEDFSLNQEEAK